MINDSKEDPVGTNLNNNNNNNKTTAGSSRFWSGFKDPRIVRVSPAFGGKDRHSKVTTIRGLRDRRVRLSVPTAIQIYDLQDKLGLNQPSKVVDWLLNAAQQEIDKLPPLKFPAINFLQFHQHSEASSKDKNIHHDQNYLNLARQHQTEGFDQISRNTCAALCQDVDIHIGQSSFQQEHLLLNSRAGNQVFGLLSNQSIPYAPYYHWDSSNRNNFSHLGRLSTHVEEAPALSYNYHMTAPPCDLDGRQLSHSQMGNSPHHSPHNNSVQKHF